MREIDAYNLCLRAIGQSAISSIDAADPDVAEIQNLINRARIEVLQNGYVFNTDIINLVPDNDNDRINVEGYLRILELEDMGYVVRSNYVYDPSTSTYVNQTLNNVRVVLDLNWNDIPDPVQNFIAHKAALELLLLAKGPNSDASYWMSALQVAASKADLLYPPQINSANINSIKNSYWS